MNELLFCPEENGNNPVVFATVAPTIMSLGTAGKLSVATISMFVTFTNDHKNNQSTAEDDGNVRFIGASPHTH